MLVMALVVALAPSAIARSNMSMDAQMGMEETLTIGTQMRNFAGMSSTYCEQNQDTNPDIDCLFLCAAICISPVFVPAFLMLADIPNGQTVFTQEPINNLSFALGLATPPPRI